MFGNGKRRSGVAVVMRKELRRFFGDRRMVIGLLMPGVVLYVVYSLFGQIDLAASRSAERREVRVLAVNLPPSLSERLPSTVVLDEVPPGADALEAAKGRVTGREADLLAVFPPDFDGQTASPGEGDVPRVRLYYDSAEEDSTAAFALLSALLTARHTELTGQRFLVNVPVPGEEEPYDLATPSDVTGTALSLIMPILLVMMMFTSCLSVAPESIAGEKERGTIATLLVTPLRRTDLAVGKILSLSLISLVGGTSILLGLLLSLPKLMEGAGAFKLDVSVYRPADFLLLVPVMLSTLLFFVAAIAVLSAAARTVKEATACASPLVLIVSVVGMSAAFTRGRPVRAASFLIPVYNSVQAVAGIFSMSYRPAEILLSVLANLLAAAVLAFLLTRLFNSERVMFRR